MQRILALLHGLRCSCQSNGDAGRVVTLGSLCLPDDALPATQTLKHVGKANGIPQLLRSRVCADGAGEYPNQGVS
ncbi:hypothetical protein NDU88_006660 [Pleurodeles waltl]|uniref:Secreted protein n=1 Tax=Pleurodeles waltl TaxID=8319 RepID=A0AAV7X0U2_PLEWA|nr:hypothetical protein NDU88_006660 [Pleurodeles waltl]